MKVRVKWPDEPYWDLMREASKPPIKGNEVWEVIAIQGRMAILNNVGVVTVPVDWTTKVEEQRMNWQETDYWKENHPPVEVNTTNGTWWIDQEGQIFQAGEYTTDLYNIGCDGPFTSKQAAEDASKKGTDYGFLR